MTCRKLYITFTPHELVNMIIMKRQKVFFVGIFIILMASGLFRVIQVDGKLERDTSVSSTAEKLGILHDEFDIRYQEVNGTPDPVDTPTLPYRNTSDYGYLGQYDFEAVIIDVGFYNEAGKRVWYGRHGGLDYNESTDKLPVEEDHLSVQLVIYGPLDDTEIRIKISREIVDAPDERVMEFSTEMISLERGSAAVIKTKQHFLVDGYNDYEFGNGFENIGKYYVDISTADEDSANVIVFGEEERGFRAGELSMLNPYDRDDDGDKISDGKEEQDKNSTLYESNPTSVDTDDDGLLDNYELDRGYSPSYKDTDGDKLGDKWEDLYQSSEGIDPLVLATDIYLNSDVDNDGFTMIQEAERGTNPNDSGNVGTTNNPPKNLNGTGQPVLIYLASPIGNTISSDDESSLSLLLLTPIITFTVVIGIIVLLHTKKRKA